MTESEYLAKLDRLHVLMDAEPGSPEELELLALGAELYEYELEHYPIDEPTPDGFVRFRAEQEGRSQ